MRRIGQMGRMGRMGQMRQIEQIEQIEPIGSNQTNRKYREGFVIHFIETFLALVNCVTSADGTPPRRQP